MKSSKSIINPYLKNQDWRVKENSSTIYSYGGLCKYVDAEVMKDYWLREVYTEDIAQAYVSGHIHIHDLGGLTLYCCGYSLKDILLKGGTGIPNIPSSKPAKHFDSDRLTYDEVKQNMQNFIFSINSNSRIGAEPAFSNVTFDLTPPEDLLDEYVTIGGEFASFTYSSCQQEMDMLNRAFFEIMLNGDADGKLFSYPIPTYNIHKRFDWDNPNNKLLWELAGKYGSPYFANYINSDMNPEDSRSMCCRLRLDLKELRKRNGGLFGSGDSTGSIGVVTINLPRIAYESNNDEEQFFKKLDYYLEVSKKSLVMKRAWLQENVIDTKLIPAFCTYVGTMDNHFSTIGVVGMNEMCENFFEDHSDIVTDKGKAFAEKVGEYIREKLIKFQEETGVLFNYEATPAESTCYRFALRDKKDYEDIITRGEGRDCYKNQRY